MGMVYPDMGSLSLRPNYGQVSYASWGTSHFMGNSKTRSFEENHSSDDAAEGKKVSDCSDGLSINLNANININEENPNDNKETDSSSGQSKLCARGHWKPAEDAKLKELVSLYGPQNWNLIADKLQGRSGILYFVKLFIGYFHIYCSFHN